MIHIFKSLKGIKAKFKGRGKNATILIVQRALALNILVCAHG